MIATPPPHCGHYLNLGTAFGCTVFDGVMVWRYKKGRCLSRV
ncbi:Uncharacterised protein [Bordetella avium]|nr:Uncharacterised protein [Bordetella avium]